MSQLPFIREAGFGPACVVCLHSNASSSAQWRGLMDRLSDRFRVIAVDSLWRRQESGVAIGPANPVCR